MSDTMVCLNKNCEANAEVSPIRMQLTFRYCPYCGDKLFDEDIALHMLKKIPSNLQSQNDKRIKCIFCKNPIHINNWAGVCKDGFICSNSFCLLELAKSKKEIYHNQNVGGTEVQQNSKSESLEHFESSKRNLLSDNQKEVRTSYNPQGRGIMLEPSDSPQTQTKPVPDTEAKASEQTETFQRDKPQSVGNLNNNRLGVKE